MPVDAAIMAIVDYIYIEGKKCLTNMRYRRRNNYAFGKSNRTVVATIKDERIEGVKLLVIQPVDRNGKENGVPLVAADSIGAGAGELVFYARARRRIPFPIPMHV